MFKRMLRLKAYRDKLVSDAFDGSVHAIVVASAVGGIVNLGMLILIAVYLTDQL